MAQKENFVVKNVRFYNFNWNTAAAIGTCSHCTAPESKGGHTTSISKIWFDDADPETATVTRRIKFNFPGNAILFDLDGTTTNMGPNSWATAYLVHNDQPGCKRSEIN